MKNYYAILEVPVGASLEDIRQAYRRLVQEHLDDEAVFADLKEAYEVLSTPTRRAEYDEAVWGGTLDSASTLGVSGLQGGRCPLGAGAACPVLQGQTLTGVYCPECGYALAGLNSDTVFDAAPPGAAQVWLEGRNAEKNPLRPGVNTVGRDSGDVLVADKTVSRSHARLELGEDGGLTVEDLGSTNGTQVNDVLLTPHAPRSLSDGDRVRFGSVSLVLHLPASGAASEGTVSEAKASEGTVSEAASGAARAQVIEIGAGDGRAFPLNPGLTTFGRRPENTVVLPGDPYVSGSHAQIAGDGDVFILTDTGSTNGTLLNSERLPIGKPFTLDSGDEILIGGTALRFERLGVSTEEAAPEEATPEEALLEEAAMEDGEPQDAPPISAEENSAEDNAGNAPEHAEG